MERVAARTRVYRKENLGKYTAYQKDYCEKNSQRIKERLRKYRAANRENRQAYLTKWRNLNRDRYLEKRRLIGQRKRVENENIRMRAALRARLHTVLKGNKKVDSAKNLLGCSLEDFWMYLESKFEPAMTRQNHGKLWHIDHIMPCAIFDLTKPEHQKRCFHFSNLQPLFGKDNLRKGSKITTDQFQLL
jgi:hypothetical protein